MNNNESNVNEGYEWPIVVRNSSRHSNLDYYYGPYDSYEDMEANVPSTVRDFGFTAAVHNADGSVTEYWLVGTSKSNLKWQQKYVQFNESISVKGSVSSLEELEAKTDNKVGDMYLIKNDDGTYSEYIWVKDREGNGHWELLGTEQLSIKGKLKFSGVPVSGTITTDDGSDCVVYDGSQNVNVNLGNYVTRDTLNRAIMRNYALGTYEAINQVSESANSENTLYFYKAKANNAACKKGQTITISFDYTAIAIIGTFNLQVHKTWEILKTFSAPEGTIGSIEDVTTSGHFSKTITLSMDIEGCDKYGLVYIQGNFRGALQLSNFKWEINDTETPWCPAPEDNVEIKDGLYDIKTQTETNNSGITTLNRDLQTLDNSAVKINSSGNIVLNSYNTLLCGSNPALLYPMIFYLSYTDNKQISGAENRDTYYYYWNANGISYVFDFIIADVSVDDFKIPKYHFKLVIIISDKTFPITDKYDLFVVGTSNANDGNGYISQTYVSTLYRRSFSRADKVWWEFYLRTADDYSYNDPMHMQLAVYCLPLNGDKHIMEKL